MQMMIGVTHPDNHVNIDIKLCSVVIPGDIKWLQQWTGLETGCLISFYESVQASSFIQSLMAWDNDRPVLQVDVCDALYDDLGAGDVIAAGDYALRFQFAPDVPVPVLQQALYSSIDHVLREIKARRILMQVHKNITLLPTSKYHVHAYETGAGLAPVLFVKLI